MSCADASVFLQLYLKPAVYIFLYVSFSDVLGCPVFLWLAVSNVQGSHTSWKAMEFKKRNFPRLESQGK